MSTIRHMDAVENAITRDAMTISMVVVDGLASDPDWTRPQAQLEHGPAWASRPHRSPTPTLLRPPFEDTVPPAMLPLRHLPSYQHHTASPLPTTDMASDISANDSTSLLWPFNRYHMIGALLHPDPGSREAFLQLGMETSSIIAPHSR